MIDYDLEAMRESLDKCDQNIKIFEEAITKEQETKMEYQRIIRTLEAKNGDSSLPKLVPKSD